MLEKFKITLLLLTSSSQEDFTDFQLTEDNRNDDGAPETFDTPAEPTPNNVGE